jgi:hypothetical protein
VARRISYHLRRLLAVRLWVAKKIDAEIYPEDNDTSTISSLSKLQYIWLKAWEKAGKRTCSIRIANR